MSVDYAAGLSYYEDLGDCGSDEIVDSFEQMQEKVSRLADLLRRSQGSCVVHAGAGLSTSAGIRDFRGKGGVWTELRQAKVDPVKVEPNQAEDKKFVERPFNEAVPTLGHMALKGLCEFGLIKHIISQNVDGLFLKSNLHRKYISELHGNFYLDECTRCRSRFIRSSPSETMRLQKSTRKCPKNQNDKYCSGFLRDTILDWESPIPYNELRVATKESKRAKLHICIGTSIQLRPSKDLVCKPTKSNNCRLVIINLQPTNMDTFADLVINYYADDVLNELVKQLDVELKLCYDVNDDPTKNGDKISTMWQK